MSLIKQFSKDSLVYGLGKGLKKFIGFLLLPVYTRALTPEDFGILDTLGAGLFFSIVFFNVGLDSAVSFFFFKPDNDKERGRILFTVFIMRLVVVIPALIMSFFAWPISEFIFGSDKYGSAFMINCLLIPVSMLMSEQEMIYRLKRNPWGYNAITIIKSLVNIGCGMLLVVNFEMGVKGAQLATFSSTLLVVLISWFTYTRKQYTYEFSKEWAKKMLKFGYPLIWAGLSVWIYQVSDRFFLLHYKDAYQVGYYSIGSTFSQPIGLINLAIHMSFGALFYQTYQKEENPDKTESKAFMRNALYLYLSLVSLAVVFLSSLSYQIVEFITTPDYLPGIIAIPVLMTSMMFAQMVEIVPQGISIAEKTWYYTWVTFAAGLINFGLNFFFIPKFGVLGAAITTLMATFSYFTLADILSKKYFNSGFSRIKVYLFCLLTLSFAFVFPYLEVFQKIKIFWALKLGAVVLFMCVPFLFGFISTEKLKSLPFLNKKK